MSRQTQLMHPSFKRDIRILWEWWVLATVAGGLIGIGIVVLANALDSYLGRMNTVALLHAVGALQGAVLGFTQWLVLRRYVKHIGWWILSTSIGAVVAWLIALKVSLLLILIFFNSAMFVTLSAPLLQAVFLLGAWVGLVLGIAQWLVLRSHVRSGALWIVANALAWGLGLLVAMIGASLVTPGDVGLKTTLVGLATGSTAGVVIGGISGIALFWLLKPRLLRHR